MPDSITIALIAGGSSLVTAALSIAVTAWLGGRNATNGEVQLGLNALREGLAAAMKSVETLSEKLLTLEAQATHVLSENNRFRRLHGVNPALSLAAFRPIDDDRFDELTKRLDK